MFLFPQESRMTEFSQDLASLIAMSSFVLAVSTWIAMI